MSSSAILTVSLHDALPICKDDRAAAHPPEHRLAEKVHREVGDEQGGYDHRKHEDSETQRVRIDLHPSTFPGFRPEIVTIRSEEHTSELQSLRHLVCRLLLE